MLDTEQRAALRRFEELLRDVGAPRGMVGRADVGRLRERHLDDALRAAPALGSAGSVCDLGAGGGLPGIPLAIALRDVRIVLAERRGNRAGFLGDVVEELRLENVHVHHGLAEDLAPGSFDACTARAFATPLATWEVADRLLRPDGFLVYWGGVSYDAGTMTPPGARATVQASAEVAGSGPLVIMTRQ